MLNIIQPYTQFLDCMTIKTSTLMDQTWVALGFYAAARLQVLPPRGRWYAVLSIHNEGHDLDEIVLRSSENQLINDTVAHPRFHLWNKPVLKDHGNMLYNYGFESSGFKRKS